MESLSDQLFEQILHARQRVYAVGKPTPLQELPMRGVSARVFAKREDLGPIKAYKWRGAYNGMAALTQEERDRGIVAASAGNHAQGVALAARALNIPAKIFMPRSTPEVKQMEVKRHGGELVDIDLQGDSYDEAAKAAHHYAEEHGSTFVHPYDDLVVMGGQGTLADEVVMSGEGPFDRVYLQIGGGGLAASVSSWIKRFWPDTIVIGVEGEGQASMKEAIELGKPVDLGYVDVFCDGTAVRKAGKYTYPICRDNIDEFITVTNDEVCHAVRTLWESARVIPEPSGAMSLAGLLKHSRMGLLNPEDKVLFVVSGANMDFTQLAEIGRRGGVGLHETRYLRVAMPGQKSDLILFLNSLPQNALIVDVQYGHINARVQHPIFGISASNEDFERMTAQLAEKGISVENVSHDEDVRFRMIPYHQETFRNPLFIQIEFPERPGAFLEFMLHVSDLAGLAYFNYAYSGERVGRALMGMVFRTPEEREICRTAIKEMVGKNIRAVHEIHEETLHRIIG